MIWRILLTLYLGGALGSIVATYGDPFFEVKENLLYAFTWVIGLPIVIFSEGKRNFRKFRRSKN